MAMVSSRFSPNRAGRAGPAHRSRESRISIVRQRKPRRRRSRCRRTRSAVASLMVVISVIGTPGRRRNFLAKIPSRALPTNFTRYRDGMAYYQNAPPPWPVRRRHALGLRCPIPVVLALPGDTSAPVMHRTPRRLALGVLSAAVLADDRHWQHRRVGRRATTTPITMPRSGRCLRVTSEPLVSVRKATAAAASGPRLCGDDEASQRCFHGPPA